MNYTHLEKAYQAKQKARMEALVRKIRERAEAVAQGRTVPDSEDIRIGTGRRLNAAIMFLDIVGFTARPSNTQPEQEAVLRMMALFFSEMFKIVDDYGGIVEKNTGDGLMAYFADGEGDPPARGSERAVSCALTMKAVHSALLNPIIIQTGYPSVAFRISMDYGPVTFANVGLPRGFNSLVAIGISANIASKLQKLAGAGDIVLGEDVVRQLSTERQGRCLLMPDATGFVRIASDAKYPAYKYDGYWLEADYA